MGNCGTSAETPFVLTPSGSCQEDCSEICKLGKGKAAGTGPWKP